MVLIAVLSCLALQRFANVGGWFHPSWFEFYLRRLSPWLIKFDERISILLVVVPVIALFALFHFVFLRGHLHGLFDLIFAIVVLFFCIDARDLKHKLKEYFVGLEKSDMHAATTAVADFIADDSMGNMAESYRAVTKAILLKSFERIFAGLFWFMVFGVPGVTTYALINLLRQNAIKVDPNYIELAKLAGQIQSILEWVPARLLGFSYALVGNFNRGFGYCIKNLWSSLSEVKRFTVDSGLAALDANQNTAEVDKQENLAALDIINRVLIIWLIALSLVWIGGR